MALIRNTKLTASLPKGIQGAVEKELKKANKASEKFMGYMDKNWMKCTFYAANSDSRKK